jgi:DNA-binding transcriptional ArsR family regulator
MSHKPRSRRVARGQAQAPVFACAFAALGDETRLALVAKLSGGEPRSISQLTKGSKLSRQAVTKHLRVLERAGIVRCVHAGRESRFEFEQKSIEEMKEYLDFVSRQWNQALSRLKAFVEE